MAHKKMYQPQMAAKYTRHEDLAVNLKINLIKELGSTFLEELASFGEMQSLNIEQGIDFYSEVRRYEIEIIKSALRFTGGNQREAAKLLSLNATTLNSKIKHFNIPSNGFEHFSVKTFPRQGLGWKVDSERPTSDISEHSRDGVPTLG